MKRTKHLIFHLLCIIMLINIYENVLAFMPVVLQIAINIECGSKATYKNQIRRYLHRKVKNS